MKKLKTEERTKIHSNGNNLCHTDSANEPIQYIDYPISETGLSNLSILMSAAASIEFAFCNVTGSICLLVCNAKTSETSSTGWSVCESLSLVLVYQSVAYSIHLQTACIISSLW